MGSSRYEVGTVNSLSDRLFTNSIFWNVIFAEIVASRGISEKTNIFQEIRNLFEKLPNLTGKPGGSLDSQNLLIFWMCLNGATISRMSNRTSTDSGKSSLCNYSSRDVEKSENTIPTTALNIFSFVLMTWGRPRGGGRPGGESRYSSHVVGILPGGFRDLRCCRPSNHRTRINVLHSETIQGPYS